LRSWVYAARRKSRWDGRPADDIANEPANVFGALQ